MTYDYHGQWDKKTGHVAPMYSSSGDDDSTLNTVIRLIIRVLLTYAFKQTGKHIYYRKFELRPLLI